MLDQLKEKNIRIKNSDKLLEKWILDSSSIAKNTKNFIRDVIENLNLQPNPEKSVIALSIGDPTIYGNLKTSQETTNALIKALKNGKHNGYAPSVGYEDSRQAVAQYLSHDGVFFNFKDIILCSGCSSSIEMSITVLADPKKNQNILIPRPGFLIYQTIAESIGLGVKYYNLIPEKDWEIDLTHLEQQIDQNTAAIVLNNPSNPCGSVFSEEHLRNFLEIAHRRRVPVIADEIYEQIVFPGKKFTSTASLKSGVPILLCGGLAKRFLVPGWRLGWIAVHDEIGAMDEIRKGLGALAGRILGPNTLVQGALPDILKNQNQLFYDNLIKVLVENAEIAYETLKNCPGLTAYKPQGTMYMMFEIQLNKFPQFKDGLKFVAQLMEEESVFCLPGECFMVPGFFRIVLTIPQELMKESCSRILDFCHRSIKN